MTKPPFIYGCHIVDMIETIINNEVIYVEPNYIKD